MWVLGQDIYLSNNGVIIPKSECQNIFISNVFEGHGISLPSMVSDVTLQRVCDYNRR